MGFASYYEDILDSRCERDKKTRHYNESQGTGKTVNVSKSQKTQRTESMKSQFKLRRSADSTRTPKSSRRKKSRPKSSRWKTARWKTAPDTRQHIRREEPLKIQPVTTDEIQQRIQREIIRQQAERYR